MLPAVRDALNQRWLRRSSRRPRRGRLRLDKPAEAHLALRAKQATKVFGEGGPPSDEGIIESQSILGSIA